MENIFIFCFIILDFTNGALFLSSESFHNVKPLDALKLESDKKEIKVTIERDSNGKFGISIRKGSNVIDYISPGSPAALHGGINAGDMIIEINSIPVDEKSDVIELFNNVGQTLYLVIRKKDTIGELQYALDGMQQFMKEHIIKHPSAPDKINRRFLSELVTCLNELDPNLLESVNAQWEGFKKLSKAEGGEWKHCHLNGTGQWHEDNCNVQTYENITIREPCNFASNLAYYHTVTEICARKNWSMPPKSVKAIGKGLALLAFGSSFFHASQTKLGGEDDSRMIDLLFWIMYQEAISYVRPGVTNVTNMNSTEFFEVPDRVLIRDLSYTPRKMNAIETADYVIKVFMAEPVEKWYNIIVNLDVPNNVRTLSAFVTAFLLFIIPDLQKELTITPIPTYFLIQEMLKFAIDNEVIRKRLEIDEHGKEDIPTPDFIIDTVRGFFPAMVKSIDNFKEGGEKELPEEDINILFKNMLGGWVKMLYGILWQEQLIDLTEIEDINKQLGFITKAGWKLVPFINQLANSITEFDHANLDFQSAKDLYPGQDSCAGRRHSHAMWHVQSGIALLDFALIADDFYRIMNLFNINGK